MNVIRLVYKLLLLPAEAIKEIIAGKYSVFSFIVLLLCIFTQTLSEQVFMTTIEKHSLTLLLVDFFITVAIFLIANFLFSMWVHFVLSLFNKAGSASGIFRAINVSVIPLLITLPITIILLFVPNNSTIYYIVMMLFIDLLLIRRIYLSIKLNYALNSGQTLLVLLSPLVFIPVICILLLLLTAAVSFMFFRMI